MRTSPIKMFRIIAVMAKKLETILREIVFTQPTIKMAFYTTNVLSATSIDMIDCKKFRARFSATGAFPAISSKNLIAASISRVLAISFYNIGIMLSPLLLICMALLTKMTWLGRPKKTDSTQPWLLSSSSINTHIASLIGTVLFLLFRSLRAIPLILLLVKTRVKLSFFYILIMTARLTVDMQSSFPISMEVFRGSRKPGIFTVRIGTPLERGIILGYSVHTVRVPFTWFLSSRLRRLLPRGGTTLLPPHYIINSLHKQRLCKIVSNVAQGVALVIAALGKYDFTWDSGAARWY